MYYNEAFLAILRMSVCVYVYMVQQRWHARNVNRGPVCVAVVGGEVDYAKEREGEKNPSL